MKKMIAALKGQTQPIPPVWFMRQAGRYLPEYKQTRADTGGFLNLCYTPTQAEEVTLQPLRRYGFDAAILFSDILVVPDGLGQTVTFQQGEGPVLNPVRDAKDLSQLSMAAFHSHLKPVYETVQRLSKSIPNTTTLIGFTGAPWTLATYMVEGRGSKDYAHTKTWAYSDPNGFQALITLLEEAIAQYLIQQIEHGAEVLQIFDSWAGVLPETEFYKWIIAPTRRIIAAVKEKHPDVPIIGFPRGAGQYYVPYVQETKVDGVSIDTTVSPAWAAKHLQPLCTVQGNLDPIMLVAGGDLLRENVKIIRDALGQGPFIFNLGHGIIPQTPPEHVAFALDCIRSA
jgi:uroporphyrinogen decarboxylase